MVSLAETKRRTHYNLQPRGKPLYEDENRFGSRMLMKMGWSKGKGLGANELGSQDFVRIRYKNNVNGLGFGARDDQWTEHEDQFNTILQSLNGSENNSDDNAGEEGGASYVPRGFGCTDTVLKAKKSKKLKEKISGESLEEKSKKSRARVHYQKFTRGKDLSRYSEKDLANIFGKKAIEDNEQNGHHVPTADDIYKQLNGFVSESKQKKFKSENDEDKNDDDDDDDDNDENTTENYFGQIIIKQKVSINDYFKQKMEALKNKKKDNNPNTNDEQVAAESEPDSDPSSLAKRKKKSKTKEKSDEQNEEESLVQVNGDDDDNDNDVSEKTKKKKKKKNKEKDHEQPEDCIVIEDSEAEEVTEKKKKKKKKHKAAEESLPEEMQNNADNDNSEEKSKEKKKKKHKDKKENVESLEDANVVEDQLEEQDKAKEKKKKKRKHQESDVAVEEEEEETEVKELETKEKRQKKKQKKTKNKEEEQQKEDDESLAMATKENRENLEKSFNEDGEEPKERKQKKRKVREEAEVTMNNEMRTQLAEGAESETVDSSHSKKKKKKSKSKDENEEKIVSDNRKATEEGSLNKKKHKANSKQDSQIEPSSNQGSQHNSKDTSGGGEVRQPTYVQEPSKYEMFEDDEPTIGVSAIKLNFVLPDTIEDCQKKYDSYNHFAISQYSADLFSMFDPNGFLGANLSQITGYGLHDNIKLDIHSGFENQRLFKLVRLELRKEKSKKERLHSEKNKQRFKEYKRLANEKQARKRASESNSKTETDNQPTEKPVQTNSNINETIEIDQYVATAADSPANKTTDLKDNPTSKQSKSKSKPQSNASAPPSNPSERKGKADSSNANKRYVPSRFLQTKLAKRRRQNVFKSNLL